MKCKNIPVIWKIFSDKVTMEESREAMSKVNTTLMEYFDERQLIVFRAAVKYAFISPYLRGMAGEQKSL